MKLLFIFVLGISILLGAIILNLIASSIGIMTWYNFLKSPEKAGMLSYIWLFVIYPFGLGIIAYLGGKLLKK